MERRTFESHGENHPGPPLRHQSHNVNRPEPPLHHESKGKGKVLVMLKRHQGFVVVLFLVSPGHDHIEMSDTDPRCGSSI